MTGTSTPPAATSDHAAWACIGLLSLAVLLAEATAPLPVATHSLTPLAVACVALAGASFFYRHVRVRDNFAVMCTALMQVLLFSALGSILSYLLARNGGAPWDARLAAWDRTLGFDWLGFVQAADSRVWIAVPLRAAYASLIPQIIALVLVLGFARKVDLLRRVMLAAIICGTISVLISPFFPAFGNYVYLGLGADDFRHVDPWAGHVHVADYTALRDGTMATIELGKMQGIITFPSYHAGLSAVTLWGFWTSGIRWLRWSGTTVALATIVATPVDGGHYLVDVLAGIAIAIASIALARHAAAWTATLPRLRASPSRRSHAASGQ